MSSFAAPAPSAPPAQSVHLVQVRVPVGMYPGSSLNVQTEDGQMYAIIVPDGVGPGDELCVDIRGQGHGATAGVVQVANTSEGTLVEPAPSSGSKAAIGAAAVGAVVGVLLIGPITGLVVAGAALYATTRDDEIGGAARATGATAVSTYDKVKEAAVRNHVGEKIAAASEATCKKASEINEEYHITEHVAAATSATINEAKKINEKYDITGKSARALMSGAASVAKFVNNASQPKSASGSANITTV